MEEAVTEPRKRGRPPKIRVVEESPWAAEPPPVAMPKAGDARIKITVAYGNTVAEQVFDIRDYAGSVPGPMKNSGSLMTALAALVRKEYNIHDVP